MPSIPAPESPRNSSKKRSPLLIGVKKDVLPSLEGKKLGAKRESKKQAPCSVMSEESRILLRKRGMLMMSIIFEIFFGVTFPRSSVFVLLDVLLLGFPILSNFFICLLLVQVCAFPTSNWRVIAEFMSGGAFVANGEMDGP